MLASLRAYMKATFALFRSLLVSAFLPSTAAAQQNTTSSTPSVKRDPKTPEIPLSQLATRLSHCGISCSNLIVGIDFSRGRHHSKRHTAPIVYNSLEGNRHATYCNAYERALCVLGGCLESGSISCFAYGDSRAREQTRVLPFYPHRGCNGIEEVVSTYKKLACQLQPGGSSSLVPVVRQALRLVSEYNTHHILLVVTEGPVADWEKCEAAIGRASRSGLLSIIVVGIGEGPFKRPTALSDAYAAAGLSAVYKFVALPATQHGNMSDSQVATACLGDVIRYVEGRAGSN